MQRLAPQFLTRLLAAVLLAATVPAQANVVITGTRIVYPAEQREVTIRLDNVGKEPALVQAWVDSTEAGTSPSKADAPFLLTPPIFRLDPDKGQSLRLMFTGATLPADRESVFWLNVLDVPPRPKAADLNYVQLAIRSRIKLFYRPKALPGSPEQAAQQLQWQLRSEGSRRWLQVRNNSAFHVSLTQASTRIAGRGYRFSSEMVAPFSSRELPLEADEAAAAASGQVSYQAIDDYGATRDYQAPLLP
ncbi:molecular chaperone [Vogesella amnigena]|uniref:Molecular chaperone n=1 Tax=Vogesella amnigena TaxID=1507449 RepID=A0ABV7TWF2_9NEIS